MEKDSEGSETIDWVAHASAHILAREWPFMSFKSREEMARKYPATFAVSGLKIHEPEPREPRLVSENDELEE